jgi:hypothetical protein
MSCIRVLSISIWCALASACEPAEMADGGVTDAGLDAARSDASGPIGGGVCCPMEFPSCDCTSTGGWAPSPGQCSAVCDAWPADFEQYVDSHGCPAWRTGLPGSESGCCICPPPRPDGGL